MIIRKPYAFLIKNFKKIHIFLLLLSFYVVYKIFDVASFISDYMQFGTYDYFNDPVTKHINLGMQIAIILIFIGAAALLFLLRYKQKPWKLYLIPIIEYAAMFFILGMIKGIFNAYSTVIKATDVRLTRDLLIMVGIAQIPAIAVFVMRVFGLDKKKFNFKQDEEYLGLSEADREEIEISLDVDKDSFKRFFRRTKRNVSYFYTEHKKICIGILVVLVIGGVYNSYKHFFVTNKSYSEGEIYSANGYTMRINKAYYTNKDYRGNVISKKSNFVIVDLIVKNNSQPRTIEMENFHIKNGIKDYVSTRKTYEKEFVDLGTTYNIVKELKRDEQTSFIIVYKVDKDLDKDKFVMYYQEKSGYLRKIKIKINDISKIKKQKKLQLGDTLKIDIANNPDNISIDHAEITNVAEYTIRNCSVTNCVANTNTLNADGSYEILLMEFGSEVYTVSKLLDFLTKYGKLTYIDSDGIKQEVEIESAISSKYYGKTIFLKIPTNVTKDTKLTLNLVIRDKEYDYELN